MAVNANSPLEAIKFLVPSLNEKELAELRKILSVTVPAASPCSRMGHKMKKVGSVTGWFWNTVTLMCERCNHTERVIG